MTELKLAERLDELREQYRLGDAQLRELTQQEVALRETLLRISGAIQVLEELIGADSATDGPAPTDQETVTVP
jgi:hypothetical protein